jgi:transposase
MTNYKEILRLHYHLVINKTKIAESLGCSRTTVIAALSAADNAGITWEAVESLSNREVKQLLYPSDDSQPQYRMPDWEYVHKEMGRTGVTLSLLWVEYCEACRDSEEIPYQSTQFYKYYRDYTQKHRATMHINRKPGDTMEVDWAGDTTEIVDPVTGEIIKAYIFVAALSYSRYAYVEAFLTQKASAWIAGHNNAYRHFGGVTRIVVPDNLKASITLNSKEETIVNRTYQEMAEHYDTAVLPARPQRPKDKPGVEGEVSVVSTWIVAALRNQKFFSLSELNAAIKEKLLKYNEREFQKKEGSRLSMYKEEKPFLRPLPKQPFEPAAWKKAKLQENYHAKCEASHLA